MSGTRRLALALTLRLCEKRLGRLKVIPPVNDNDDEAGIARKNIYEINRR